MISKAAVRLRRFQRATDGTRLLTRMLGFVVPEGRNAATGLVALKVEGLSVDHLEPAIRRGDFPYVSKAILHGWLHLKTVSDGATETYVETNRKVETSCFEVLRAGLDSPDLKQTRWRRTRKALIVSIYLRMVLKVIAAWMLGLGRISFGAELRGEISRFLTKVQIERGDPAIRHTFSVYQTQTGGGGSKAMDRSFRDIWRSAARSDYRDYEIIIFSDNFALLSDGIAGDVLTTNRQADFSEAIQQLLAGYRPPLRIHESKAKPWLRIATYNIHSCVGVDGKLRPERVARLIHRLDADLVAIQEVDAFRRRSGLVHQAETIAGLLKMDYSFQSMLGQESEHYGIAILSRYPMKVIKSAFLTEADPQRLREARGAIWITVILENHPFPINLINTHFGLSREERLRQIQVLAGPDWLGKIDPREPVIVCGDFNSSSRSRIWKTMKRSYRDVQQVAPGHRPRATFATIRPFAQLDHILVSQHWKVVAAEVPDFALARLASDHFPLLADLELPAEIGDPKTAR